MPRMRPSSSVAIPIVPVLVAFLDRGEKVLAAILDPPHGSFENSACHAGHRVFGIQEVLPAERAPHVGNDDPDPMLVRAEELDQTVADLVRGLRRRPHRQHVGVGLVVGNDAARLDGVRAAPMLLERDPERVRSVGECGGAVPVLGVELGDHVVGGCRVHGRRTRGQRFAAIRHRRQRLVVDIDQRGGVLGDIARIRQHHGDRFSGEAHLLFRDDDRLRRFGELPGLVVGRDVVRREHGLEVVMG